MLFDFAVFAHWPRGLYLAKKLSEEGGKVAYVELLPRLKNPFGLFLSDSFQEGKEFLETLGFLSRQEGGFCLLSPQGVWPLQNMREMGDRQPVLKNELNLSSQNAQLLQDVRKMRDHHLVLESELSENSFNNHWLSYLALNLAGKVFEYNNSEFSEKGLNLFSDYFLFSADFKKTKQFKTDHPDISFYETQLEEISYEKKKPVFSLQNQLLESEKYFWLGDKCLPALAIKKTYGPYWEWSACFFSVDFGDYENIIPSHFVSLKHLVLPWSHDNLLSVFRKNGFVEVWTRNARENVELPLQGIKEHLETFFPGCVFSPMEKQVLKGPMIYGKGSLKPKTSVLQDKVYIEDLNDFFQLDLISEIHAENELCEILLETD